MPVENIYWGYRSDFIAVGLSASWSVDFNIPAQTVYASAALSYVNGTVWCGVAEYFVHGDKKGRLPSGAKNNGVVPAIFESNVVTVTYSYGADDGAGDCNFQILGFG
jgi:hypothetical protein